MVGCMDQHKTWMFTAPARWEYFPLDAGDLVFFGVPWIVGHAIDAGGRYLVARLIFSCHSHPPGGNYEPCVTSSHQVSRKYTTTYRDLLICYASYLILYPRHELVLGFELGSGDLFCDTGYYCFYSFA